MLQLHSLVECYNFSDFTKSKKGSGFPKEYSLEGFKNFPFSNSSFPFEKQDAVLGIPKCSDMATLFNITNLTPGTISSHKKSCSMKVNVFHTALLSEGKISTKLPGTVKSSRPEAIWYRQKQSPGGVLSKRYSEKISKIHRRTTALESPF